ncbi:MAG: polysaccharide biosynthesis C-terminal domain-containing protein, partial [Oscillospiraceae bacterium]|nr:polysaccharide biosynthesis C-terminal domain-containing protein [Oscillospiraceae bacterium]
IAGAAWGTLLGYAVIAALNLLCVRRAAGRGVCIVSALWRSAAATLVMAMFARGSYAFLAAKMEPTLATLLAIALAVVVYGILALAVGAVRKEDVKHLPFGRKLTKFVPFS